MTTVVVAALMISFGIYLYIGLSNWKHTKGLGDLIPIMFGKTASVRSTDEFSSSTVAATISLATVIIAYFELASYFGFWLFWTAITTSLGLAVVSFAGKRIWKKLSAYKHRPSLHEFLGSEFNSFPVALVGAICTSFGFLLIFATELIVGSQFLAKLIPSIPEWLTVIVLCLVGFTYTVLGGFRAVIKSDQIQMKFIWAFIGVLGLYYLYYFLTNGGISYNLSKVPKSVFDFSPRPGLVSFIIGISIMNIPLYISSMSIWQRIAGSQKPETVISGLRSSIFSSAFSWGALVLLSCLAFTIVPGVDNKNLFTDLLMHLGTTPLGLTVVFFVVLGLFGAMLSTSSTNLIVVAHTIYEDIYAAFQKTKLDERLTSSSELLISRGILTGAAIFAIVLVEGLKYLGFSIADLAFSIYGSGLALCPTVITALYVNNSKLKKLGAFASAAIIAGFVFGWGSAIIGKVIGNADMIFLAPCFSFGVSAIIMIVGIMIKND